MFVCSPVKRSKRFLNYTQSISYFSGYKVNLLCMHTPSIQAVRPPTGWAVRPPQQAALPNCFRMEPMQCRSHSGLCSKCIIQPHSWGAAVIRGHGSPVCRGTHSVPFKSALKEKDLTTALLIYDFGTGQLTRFTTPLSPFAHIISIITTRTENLIRTRLQVPVCGDWPCSIYVKLFIQQPHVYRTLYRKHTLVPVFQIFSDENPTLECLNTWNSVSIWPWC